MSLFQIIICQNFCVFFHNRLPDKLSSDAQRMIKAIFQKEYVLRPSAADCLRLNFIADHYIPDELEPKTINALIEHKDLADCIDNEDFCFESICLTESLFLTEIV